MKAAINCTYSLYKEIRQSARAETEASIYNDAPTRVKTNDYTYEVLARLLKRVKCVFLPPSHCIYHSSYFIQLLFRYSLHNLGDVCAASTLCKMEQRKRHSCG